MKVILAKTLGFCGGVQRAIKIAEEASAQKEATILGELVHNEHVISDLKKEGLKFSSDLDSIKKGTVIFSAHGVPPSVKECAKKKKLNIIDATCSLVLKIHILVRDLSKKGFDIILIGKKGHTEIIGIEGEAPEKIYLVSNISEIKNFKPTNPEKVAVVTQTTLSFDDTKEIIGSILKKFPKALVYNTICNATQIRQEAVKELAKRCSVILVVGSTTSSNSNRLKEVAEMQGAKAYLVGEVSDIKKEWLKGVDKVGVTGGASTPAYLVEGVVLFLQKL